MDSLDFSVIAVALQAETLLIGAYWEEHLLMVGGFILGGVLKQLARTLPGAAHSQNIQLPFLCL